MLLQNRCKSDIHESDSSDVNSIINFLKEKSEDFIQSIRRRGKY